LAAFRAILTIFHCACAETAIYELLVKTMTPAFDSLTPTDIPTDDILATWRRFLLIFALDNLNFRHISTSGLVDLLI